MTRIDFHTNIADKFLYTCRLVRKALSVGASTSATTSVAKNKIIILVSNSDDLLKLDQMLWTFSEQDFLPHVKASDPLAAQTPIILATASDATTALPHHQMLINLSGDTPADFARFERVFEIVTQDEIDKINSRERYRFYQQGGYPLTHFVADKV